MYTVKASWWLRMMAPPRLIWGMPVTGQPTVYLSFDDGPHPTATPFVLQQLKAYDAKATFFCIGKCVNEHPDIYRQVKEDGHSIGNHTYNHLNGWKTTTSEYLGDIGKAETVIDSHAFRPPYGRLSRAQASALKKSGKPWKVYMWSILSGDFDTQLSPEKCLDNVLSNIEPGSIIVFHDSAKAWDRLRYTLPFVLDYCKTRGWSLEGLPMN